MTLIASRTNGSRSKRDWLTARTLSKLARAEWTLAERCRETIPAVTMIDARSVNVLAQCLRSHLDRRGMLVIELLGRGEPIPEGLGLRHMLAIDWQRLISRVSDRAALAGIRAAERRHRRRYRIGLRWLKGTAYQLLQGQLFPEQDRIDTLLATLRRRGRIVALGAGR